MTEQREAAADLAVCQAATPGPWVLSTSGYAVRLADDDGEQMEVVADLRGLPRFSVEQMVDNGLFVALAREALPWWIDEAERRRAENAALRAALQLRREEATRDGE